MGLRDCIGTPYENFMRNAVEKPLSELQELEEELKVKMGILKQAIEHQERLETLNEIMKLQRFAAAEANKRNMTLEEFLGPDAPGIEFYVPRIQA